MNPAQGMIGDAELSGIVGHDHRVAHQSMVAHRAPEGRVGDLAHQGAVEDIQAQPDQMIIQITKAGDVNLRRALCQGGDRHDAPGEIDMTEKLGGAGCPSPRGQASDGCPCTTYQRDPASNGA